MLLDGNKVVVIGGSSGIGLAISRQARMQGASLVIVGRDPVKALGCGVKTRRRRAEHRGRCP